MTITNYTAVLTGIATGNTIQANHFTVNFNAIEAAINNTNTTVTAINKFRLSQENTYCIRSFDTTKLTTAANEINITANAVTAFDPASPEAETTGWGAKSLTGLADNTSGYVWIQWDGGSTKDYETSEDTAALPSPIDEYFLIGTYSVNGSGVVTFTSSLQKIWEQKANIFDEDQQFLGDVLVIGDVLVKGGTTFKGNITTEGGHVHKKVTKVFADSPYTALTTDEYINVNCTGGEVTVNLYTAVGNDGRRLVITKTDSSTNFVVIDGNGSETISGQTTVKLYSQYQSFILISDGTNWQVEGGLPVKQLIQAQTASNVANIDFKLGIDSAFNQYLLEMTNVLPATDDTELYLRLSTDGGSTFISAAASYMWQYGHDTSAGTYNVNNSDTQILLLGSSAASGGLSNAANETSGGEARIYLPSSASNRTIIKSEHYGVTAAGNSFHGRSTSQRKANEVNNAFQVYMGSGNISTGTFRLYGIR